MLGTVLQVSQEDSSAPRYLVVRTALSEERANNNQCSPSSSATNARVMSFHIPRKKNPHASRSPMMKYATQHLHQNCLCRGLRLSVATAIRRTVIHCQGRLSLSTDGDKCAMVNFFLGGGMKNQLWGNEKV